MLNAGERQVDERTRKPDAAYEQVTRLEGMLTVCAWCQRIRDHDESWLTLDAYLHRRTNDVSHGMCPHCAAAVMAEAMAKRPGAVNPQG